MLLVFIVYKYDPIKIIIYIRSFVEISRNDDRKNLKFCHDIEMS